MIGLSNSSTPNTLSSTATVAAVTTQFIGIVQEVGETSFSYYTRGSSSSTKVDSLITCQTASPPNTGMYTLTIKNAPGSNNVDMTLEYMATGGASASTSISFTAGTTSTISNSNACYVLMQRNLAPGTSSAGQLSLIGIRMYYR
jgi:archaellin